MPDHGGLRWHPTCPWEGGTKPVRRALTTAVDNKPRGIWRRPIDGTKPKALAPTAGCVNRLWPDAAVETALVLGEGVETTLAASTRIEHRGTLLQPAWAAGSAGNMANFPVLSGIEALTILVDNDSAASALQINAELDGVLPVVKSHCSSRILQKPILITWCFHEFSDQRISRSVH